MLSKLDAGSGVEVNLSVLENLRRQRRRAFKEHDGIVVAPESLQSEASDYLRFGPRWSRVRGT